MYSVIPSDLNSFLSYRFSIIFAAFSYRLFILTCLVTQAVQVFLEIAAKNPHTKYSFTYIKQINLYYSGFTLLKLTPDPFFSIHKNHHRKVPDEAEEVSSAPIFSGKSQMDRTIILSFMYLLRYVKVKCSQYLPFLAALFNFFLSTWLFLQFKSYLLSPSVATEISFPKLCMMIAEKMN